MKILNLKISAEQMKRFSVDEMPTSYGFRVLCTDIQRFLIIVAIKIKRETQITSSRMQGRSKSQSLPGTVAKYE